MEKQERRRDRWPVFPLELIQPDDRRVKIIVGEKAQHPRRGDAHDLFIFLIHPSRQDQRCVGSRLVKPLKRRQLSWLVFPHALGALMAGDSLQQC